MPKSMAIILFFVLCFSLIGNGFTLDSEKRLTTNDVEKVTEIQGIKLIPRNPALGAGGDLNFAMEDNTLFLTVAIQDSSMYKQWKSEEGFFHADVSGIGDEAFEGPSIGEQRYILIFRKGKKAVSLSSFFDMKAGGKPFLSQGQLRELAKIIISRL
ncbi:hypothetical protein ACFLT2_04780 [Acidobacteriota bacterium]